MNGSDINDRGNDKTERNNMVRWNVFSFKFFENSIVKLLIVWSLFCLFFIKGLKRVIYALKIWNFVIIEVVRDITTVKYVYSDHAYDEMTLITERLWIPGNHSIFYAYSEVAYNEITLNIITK